MWKTNPQGQKLLQDLADPAKYDTIRTLALGIAVDAAPGIFDERGERKRRAARSRVAPFATDSPPQRATTGQEAEQDMSKWPAAKVLDWIQQHPDQLPAE